MPRRLALPALLAVIAPAVLAAQAPGRAGVVARVDSIAQAGLARNVAGLSIAVVKGRDTLVMKGYGLANRETGAPATERTVHRTGSLTKQFTSAAIMQYVDAGRLRLDDTLGALLPKVPRHWHAVTLRQLLNHTSGIPSYTDVARVRPYLERRLERDTLFALLRGDSLMFAPGGGYYYNNTGYYLLGILLEQLSGKPYAQHVQERLFAPLGMRSTSYCPDEPAAGHATGYDADGGGMRVTRGMDMNAPFSAGAICSTVGDLVTWTRALAAGRVVSRASYEAMTTPVAVRSVRPNRYGFGLERDSLEGHRAIQHGGNINGFASYASLYPDDSLVVVVLANTSGAPARAIADNVARAALGLPPLSGPAPLAEVPTTPAERALLAGRYRMTQPDGTGREVTVEEVDGQLTARLGAGQGVRLYRVRDNAYAVVGMPGARILFDVQDGRAVGFVLDRGARPLPATRLP